jgi:hypothetical protein
MRFNASFSSKTTEKSPQIERQKTPGSRRGAGSTVTPADSAGNALVTIVRAQIFSSERRFSMPIF